MNEVGQESNYFDDKPQALVRQKLPVVDTLQKLKLLHIDGGQAYFIDSKNHQWYFDSAERLWRETTSRDIHPMK